MFIFIILQRITFVILFLKEVPSCLVKYLVINNFSICVLLFYWEFEKFTFISSDNLIYAICSFFSKSSFWLIHFSFFLHFLFFSFIFACVCARACWVRESEFYCQVLSLNSIAQPFLPSTDKPCNLRSGSNNQARLSSETIIKLEGWLEEEVFHTW